MTGDPRSDDWLWDRTGAPDPEIERLEALLGGFGLDDARAQRPGDALRARTVAARPRRTGGASSRVWLRAAAVVVAAGLLVTAWLLLRAPGRPRFAASEFVAVLVDAQRDPVLRLLPGERHVVGPEATRLQIGSRAQGFDIELVLTPGSHFTVEALDPARSLVSLTAGQVDASVDPTLPAGALEIATPFGTCIDLGCRYVLSIDPDADSAELAVTVGKVAFEDHARRVLVPAGAEVRASAAFGIGTPVFAEGAGLSPDLLRKFDESPADSPYRPDLAEKIAFAAGTPRDTLPLWHLFQDSDERVRTAAVKAMVRLVGRPRTKMLDDPGAWWRHLEERF